MLNQVLFIQTCENHNRTKQNYTANTKRWHNAELLLAYRLRRWSNISPTLGWIVRFYFSSYEAGISDSISSFKRRKTYSMCYNLLKMYIYTALTPHLTCLLTHDARGRFYLYKFDRKPSDALELGN